MAEFPKPPPLEPTLADLRQIADAETLRLLEHGDPNVRAALEAEWKQSQVGRHQSDFQAKAFDSAPVYPSIELLKEAALEEAREEARQKVRKRYRQTKREESQPVNRREADSSEKLARSERTLRGGNHERVASETFTYESSSHSEWLWGGTGVLVTLLAVVFWGVLFVVAGLLYGVGIYRAPWFKSRTGPARHLIKTGIFSIILVTLFGFWWLVPQPDFAKSIREAIRVPSPTPTASPIATATPEPALTVSNSERSVTTIRPQGSPISSPIPSALEKEPPRPSQTIPEPVVMTPTLERSVSVIGSESDYRDKSGRRDLKDLRLLSNAIVTIRSATTQEIVFQGRTDTFLARVNFKLPVGTYDITVEHSGYKKAQLRQSLSPSDKSSQIYVELIAEPKGFRLP